MNKAQIVAWLFLTAMCVGGVWRIGKPSTQVESDQQVARSNKNAMRVSGRLAKPRDSELLKRLKAIKRRGDQLTKQYKPQRSASE